MQQYCRTIVALALALSCYSTISGVSAAMGGKAETPKPEVSRPEAPKAAPTKPEASRPEAPKAAPAGATAPGMGTLESPVKATTASGGLGSELMAAVQAAPMPLGGQMGEQMTTVMGNSGGPGLSPGSVPGLPGTDVPSMSIGGTKDALSPVGGMPSPLNMDMDGFPPFFGDGGTPQATPPQAVPQPTPPPAPPAAPPSSPGQDMGAQALQGALAANDGKRVLIMMFSNGICGLMFNGQQCYGPYTVQGNRLHIRFNNGQSIDVTFSVQGNTLRFSDGTVLVRQQMPNAPAASPIPGGAQQPGGIGTPQPMPPVTPPASSGNTTPLEGVWSTQLPNGAQVVFIFMGNRYRVLTNGQPTEEGTFTLNGNRLEYVTTAGQAAGQRGANTWQCNGVVLVMTLPHGASVQFHRQQP